MKKTVLSVLCAMAALLAMSCEMAHKGYKGYYFSKSEDYDVSQYDIAPSSDDVTGAKYVLINTSEQLGLEYRTEFPIGTEYVDMLLEEGYWSGTAVVVNSSGTVIMQSGTGSGMVHAGNKKNRGGNGLDCHYNVNGTASVELSVTAPASLAGGLVKIDGTFYGISISGDGTCVLSFPKNVMASPNTMESTVTVVVKNSIGSEVKRVDLSCLCLAGITSRGELEITL